MELPTDETEFVLWHRYWYARAGDAFVYELARLVTAWAKGTVPHAPHPERTKGIVINVINAAQGAHIEQAAAGNDIAQDKAANE